MSKASEVTAPRPRPHECDVSHCTQNGERKSTSRARSPLVKVDVAHDHHVSAVAEDPAQALDLPTLAEVLGRVCVPELVCSNPKADAVAHAAEELRHRWRPETPDRTLLVLSDARPVTALT
jgi:hypothetical protein